MRNSLSVKVFVYFLCVSFLVMMNGFRGRVAEAKEKSLPIGLMISRGEVKFEAKENIWKLVEPSAFPLFQGTRIKTEKGVAVIFLQDLGQVRVGQNSLFSYDQRDRLLLFQGSIDFRIRTAAEMRFGIGTISIVPSRSFQASRNSSSISNKNEEVIGSISVHSNGGVTVKTIQGSLTVIDQGQTVLAALSSGQDVTIPFASVKSGTRVVVAQASDPATAGSEGAKGSGFSVWEWVGVGVAIAGVAGIAVYGYESTRRDGGDDFIPICP